MATPTLQVQPSTPARTSTVQRAQQPAAVVQRAAWVSSPSDPAEKEAEHTAKKVMRMADPQVGRVAPAGIAQFVQRAGGRDNSAGPAAISTQIDAAAGGGRALPHGVKGFMESRFQANFSKVRVHTDQRAAKLNTQLGARAFTTGNHVFFGAGQFQPESADGRELIAHELTHTIQQGAARQVRRAKAPVDEKREPLVQRLGVSDVLDYFADAAYNIPGYRMFTIVIGVNPINMSAVDRSAANILRAVVEFIPGGGLIVQALDNYGVFDRAGAFIEQQLRTLGITGSAIRSALMRFVDSLSWTDIFDLGGVWDRAVAIFSNPVNRIISFVGSLGAAVLQMIKDAILRPLAGLASRTRAWDLLCAVLGENPITGDPVPRTAETLIGGFMKLIGKEEIWQNIQRANAIPRAWAWFQGAIQGLVGLVRQIPPTFMAALAALRIDDIVQLPTAFQRVASIFANFIGDFLRWAGDTVWSLLEIIFEVVAPGAMPYLRRAAGAFRSILQNPIGFIGNLVRAGIRGFEQFSTNFLTHLRASLIGWLTGAMSGAGLYIPRSFSLVEILKFVLSVLGLTWQNIRTKLVRAVGETAVVAMERGFELIRTLVTEGPAAAWQQILEGLQNLQQIVIEGVMNFVKQRIVVAAVTRLVGMLNPAGAFIQAIIAIYNTVMFFVERLRQIIQVATAFMDSIMAIASGNIASAANRVEQTMAGMLTLVISFLARLAGLGRVADAVRDIINRVRAPIDRALDRVVTWIVEQARRLGRFVAQAGVPQDPNERLRLGLRAAVAVCDRFAGRPVASTVLTPLFGAIRTRYGFTRIDVEPQGRNWAVRAHINPSAIAGTRVIVQTNQTTGEQTNVTIVSPPKVLTFEFRRFTANQTVSFNEITTGLNHHQNALNDLTIDAWLSNIAFYPFLRGAIAAEERDIGRKLLIQNLRREITEEYQQRGVTLSRSQLDSLVRMRSRGTHASHSADFVSGGNIDDFDSLERGAINSYIGSNWGRWRPELDSYARFLRQRFEPPDRSRVKMNFRLRPSFLN